MNERIKELIEQSTTHIEPTSTSGEGWIFDKEKFAELIVKECIQVLDPGGHQLIARFHTRQWLSEHFGIK
jgi:hypothetical protein